MPDRSTSDDWGALAWRVRTLEDRTDEDRRSTQAMIEHMQTQIKQDYLSAEQIARRYVSRDEARGHGQLRREWLLVWVAVIATTGSVVQILTTISRLH